MVLTVDKIQFLSSRDGILAYESMLHGRVVPIDISLFAAAGLSVLWEGSSS